MDDSDRRQRSRITCTTGARYEVDGECQHALVTDLSLTGLRLSGVDLPAPGTDLTLSVLSPSNAIVAVGHVRWVDRSRRVAGLELDRDGSDARAFCDALLSLAFETDSDRPAVALVVEDPRLAARLCDTSRRHGMSPRMFATPLQLLSFLDQRTALSVVVVQGQAMGMSVAEWTSVLAEQHPALARLAIGDADIDRAEQSLGELLDRTLLPLSEPEPSKRGRRRRTVKPKLASPGAI